jgi:hypothetical protein
VQMAWFYRPEEAQGGRKVRDRPQTCTQAAMGGAAVITLQTCTKAAMGGAAVIRLQRRHKAALHMFMETREPVQWFDNGSS